MVYQIYSMFCHNITDNYILGVMFILQNPQAPPPPEPQWADEVTNVVHLQQNNFRSVLKKKKHALVMFYAPC